MGQSLTSHKGKPQITDDNLIDLDELEYQEGSWSWQSNVDPWSETEQPQWQEYSANDNATLEKAFKEKKPEADLGQYFVLLKNMLQVNKQDMKKQRKVRRLIIERKEKDRTNRFIDAVPPFKTVNHAFGSVKDMQRMFEAKYQLTGYNKATIQQKAKIIAQGIMKEAQRLGPDEVNDARYLIKQLSKASKKDQKEFEAVLLNLYTQETFLYRQVNSLLRGEMWMELTDLAPFIFELVPTFTKTVGKDWFDVKLYRGTTMDQACLSTYKPWNYFSWNSFTSASRNKAIAESFSAVKEGYTKVLFTITYGDTSHRMFKTSVSVRNNIGPQVMDVSKISRYPKEEEVIFAPGSLFRVADKQMVDDICLISLQHWDYWTAQCCDLHIGYDFGRAGILSQQELSWEGLKRNLAKKNKLISVSSVPNRYSNELAQLFAQGTFIEEIHLDGCETEAEKKIVEALSSLKVSKFEWKKPVNKSAITVLDAHLANSCLKDLRLEQFPSGGEFESLMGNLHLSKVEKLYVSTSGNAEALQNLLLILPKSMIKDLHLETSHLRKFPENVDNEEFKTLMRNLPLSKITNLDVSTGNIELLSNLMLLIPNSAKTYIRLELEKNGLPDFKEMIPHIKLNYLSIKYGKETIEENLSLIPCFSQADINTLVISCWLFDNTYSTQIKNLEEAFAKIPFKVQEKRTQGNGWSSQGGDRTCYCYTLKHL